VGSKEKGLLDKNINVELGTGSSHL
jgi:hypothetical protein